MEMVLLEPRCVPALTRLLALLNAPPRSKLSRIRQMRKDKSKSTPTRLTSYQSVKGCEAGPGTKNESISVHEREPDENDARGLHNREEWDTD
ncbi:hypothetical protein L1987_52686 [Smallanthus sonchifolius]|uniref:Uncharacterized protein n=1 Tax=Smallanthus sonchifolius TaxID=185202 RepID=A0ACB9EU89_9ASTR|nr:hypothetical protein L1987_52686 [Smallanthus sonchifolius]